MRQQGMTALLLAAALALFSTASIAEGIQKLGFINTERVYRESKSAQAIVAKLEREFKPQQAELQKMQQRGLALQKTINDKKTTAADRQRAQEEWLDLNRQFRSLQAKVSEEYALRRNEEFASVQQYANQVIVDLAKKEGYDVILQDVVYVNAKYDITDAVIRQLNR